MSGVQVASRQDWLVARKRLLASEEEAARRLAEVGAQRRALPAVKLEKEYVFDGPEGKVELLDLFAGRRQLIVYHFMFDPAWEQGCKFCSYLVDNIGDLSHMYARDTTLVLVSRAPPVALVAVGLAAFTACQTAGRLVGDRLHVR
ncbi:DUF899 family protein [Plantactinospora veratri]|uniref:DUF899 family protein n=1 Tax=Plantactinospora veratri TaxID=1436122 RepID=A0ABU7SAP3_9ACTN